MGNNDYRKRKRKTRKEKESEADRDTKIQAVMFIQHTPYSEMAKRMRKKLESLEKLGQFKIKLVERAGNKVVDVLHKSDAWSMMDCEREDCLICKTETSRKGTCRRRNILYETFCITCKDENKEGEEVILEGENKSKNLFELSPVVISQTLIYFF